MQRGLFISIEGIDGAGKSSHIKAMAQAFEQAGHTVVLTREPGGTALAEKIRTLLLHDAMDPVSETLLAFAARRDHLRQTIIPALSQGHTVICDRFTDATFAYQGGGRDLPWAPIAQLEQWVQTDGEGNFYEPDCTLFFDVPAAVAAQRLQGARAPDRFEAQAVQFFEQVARAYEQRQTDAPARFVRINSNVPMAQVFEQVLAALVARGYLPPSSAQACEATA